MSKNNITMRKPLYGNRRSHAMNANRRRWNLNLQKTKIKTADGQVITAWVTTRELRTIRKQALKTA